MSLNAVNKNQINKETQRDPQGSPSPSKKIQFVTFISPLSKEIDLSRKRKFAEITNDAGDTNERPLKIRRNLLKTFESTVCEAKDLKKLYGIDFEHPPARVNKNHFFELRDQLLLIESCLLNNSHADARAKIKKIVNNATLSHEQKMGELGAIFYFLEKYQAIPSLEGKSSYTELRALEILEEIQRLEEHLDTICNAAKENIPSGKTQYLLRALTRMVLSQQQKLNVGALYTIQQILNSSNTTFVCYVSSEHRDHILVVLKNLLAKPQFKILLERKVDVHPDIADLVRLDLKLPKNEAISSCHVMWACLMALFFDTRQVHQANCSAIAVLIYATQNATYKVLSKMIDWMTTGHIGFNDSITIPIYPLIEYRLVYEKDLQVKLKPKSALALTTIEKITDVIGISPEEYKAPTGGMKTLQTTLNDLLQANESEEDLVYALKTYHTFKRSAIMETMATMLEFYEANINTEENANSPFSAEKQRFINALMQPLKQKSQKFRKLLVERLGQKIWLQNYTETNLIKKDDRLILGPQHAQYEIADFEGDFDALEKVLGNAQRIFILENGKYVLLKSISELRNVIRNIASDISKELNYKDTTTKGTLSVINNKKYLTTIANFCAVQINDKGITTDALQEADILLLKQPGISDTACLHSLGIKYESQTWKQKSPLDCIEQLFNAFKNIDLSVLENTPLFLISTKHHGFTISPKKCSLIWKKHEQFEQLNETVQAENYLNKSIPPNVAIKIAQRIQNEGIAQNKKLPALLKRKQKLTYAQFRTLLMSNVEKAEHKKLEKIIDQEYYKVKLSSEQIRSILTGLELKIDEDVSNELLSKLEARFKEKRAYPYQIAAFLRKKLIQRGLPIIDPYDLEKAICQEIGQPPPLIVGDLNWVNRDTEAPKHTILVVRTHFGQDSSQFYIRLKDREIQADMKDYHKMWLFYPTV